MWGKLFVNNRKNIQEIFNIVSGKVVSFDQIAKNDIKIKLNKMN